jgi:hypothetical protein
VTPDSGRAGSTGTGGSAGEGAVAERLTGRRRALLAGFREPVVAVLLAIAFFTTISGKPVDGLLMLIVAVSLAADATGLAARGGGRRARRQRAGAPAGGWRRAALAAALAVAGVLYAGVAGSFSRYSWPATVAVVGLGTAVVVTGWQGPLRQRPARAPLPAVGTALWGGLLVLGGLWELAALLWQPSLTATSYAHPTLSALTDPVLASAGGRSLVLGGWLAAGWYLVRR